LVYFIVILFIFPRFGKLHQENSGNPFFFGLRKKFIALDSGSILPRQAFTPSRALSRNLTTA
jgi:hypothetical protein